MGRWYRAHSPTPSVESDAPVPETLQEGSPGAKNLNAWMIFVGNLHPKVTETDLYNLFGGRDHSRNAIIRTTRGCGVTAIPGEEVGPNDRCYASIEVMGLNRTKEIMSKYRKNPPKLYGLPLTIGHSPADMPDFFETMERAMEYVSGKAECTEKSIPGKRLAVEKTLEDIEAKEQPRSLAGPSRSSAKPKPKYDPMGVILRRERAQWL